MSPIRRTFTVEEYERLAKFGLLGRTELLNGEIWSMETGRPWMFTVDAVYRMVEAGVLRRDELPEVLDGALVVRPIADPQEAAVIDRIARALVVAIADRAIVRIRGPLRLGGTTEVTPGVVILKTREDWYRDFCPGAPDVLLVVEVVLGGMHSDVSERVSVYSRMGVPEVWLADVEAEALEVARDPDGSGGYRERRHHGRADEVTPRALPQIRLRAGDLL
jgi:Uma2 family endonuclease